MAIPKFLEDLAIISKLGDNPGADNGLSTSAFRAKFDEAALKIQTYMNEVLIPNLDALVDASALLNSILDKTLSKVDKAAEAKAVGDALANKLDSTGGTMTGPLNVAAPAEETHAANKGYVDGQIAAAKKYADDKHFELTATIPVSRWYPIGSVYQNDLTVEGLLGTDKVDVDIFMSDASIEAMDGYMLVDEEFAKIYHIPYSNNAMSFRAREIPTVDIPIKIKVVR